MVLKLYDVLPKRRTYEREMIYMMLVPRRSNSFLFDNFFGDDDFFTRPEHHLMKTDIKEKKDKYIIEMDLPGYSKENINLELKNGYLEVSAKVEKEEKNSEEEKFVRRERFYGECARSFYVGDDIMEEDINAEFKNGTLRIDIPKKEEKPKLSENKKIAIK